MTGSPSGASLSSGWCEKTGENKAEQIYIFCRWIDWNKLKNKFIFLEFFVVIFLFFYLLSWCSSPGSRFRRFPQLTPRNGRRLTSRGLRIFFHFFFFIWFLFKCVFFLSCCIYFLEMLTMSRESHPSRNPFICILESDKKPTKENEKIKIRKIVTWHEFSIFLKFSKKKKLRTNMADDKFLCIGRLDLSFRKNIFII